MFKMTAYELAGKSCCFRYAYFILTTFRPISVKSWRAKGEPNPFVAKTYPTKVTEMVDFVDIFEEYQSSRRGSFGKPFSRRTSTSGLL